MVPLDLNIKMHILGLIFGLSSDKKKKNLNIYNIKIYTKNSLNLNLTQF